MNVNDVKNMLDYNNKIMLIGSNKLNLKYNTDYDYQVKHQINPKNIEERQQIVEHFRNIFNTVKNTKRIKIMEFKSGIFIDKLIWNYDEVMLGEKIVDDNKLLLLNNLDNCKIDIIAYTGKLYEEFSCNYYFYPESSQDINNSLLLDVKKYYHEENYMKMMKRLLSYRLYNKLNVDDFIEFFNNEAGRLYQKKHRMEVRKKYGLVANETEIKKLQKKLNGLVVEFVNI